MNKYRQIQHVLCTVYLYLGPNLDISCNLRLHYVTFTLSFNNNIQQQQHLYFLH